MDALMVPAPVREKLGDAGSNGLVTMFASAHRLATESFERTLRESETRFERRLAEETAKLAMLSWMLRDLR